MNKVCRQLKLTIIINFSAGELSSNTQWLDQHEGLCPLREDPARGICYLCCIWYLVFVFVSDYKTTLLLREHLARGGIDIKGIDNDNDMTIT